MSSKLSKKEVEKIAQLARLELTDDEIKKYSEQLSGILDYIDQLQEVDIENVEITTQVTGLSNVMREDKVQGCDNPSELVEMAPEHEKGLIKVKAVFDTPSS
jgi:aspartyl-tRNA(Asn)/glutamyl-tRNA(Gln) amidotransferase subunit C|tara:strand:- start:199 stop:504 length:306 start_codon:yes stop_codon:yes gene_type:complete